MDMTVRFLYYYAIDKKDEKHNMLKSTLRELYYTKFKYLGNVYSVGDDVEIFNSESQNSVAKILKIITFNGIKKNFYWPTIEVQWYYKKTDLSVELLSQRELKCLSDFEVFLSNHKDVIYIESIVGKCKVLKFSEYEVLEEYFPGLYFTRALYNPIKVSPNLDIQYLSELV